MGKRKSVLTAVLLILALTLSACALGRKGEAADALERSQETLQTIRSLHYDTVLELSLSAQGQSLDMTTTTAVDYIASPLIMKLEFSVALGGETDDAATILYLVEENGGAALYMDTDEGSGLQWTREEVSRSELERYDAVTLMDFYFTSGQGFAPAAEETVKGARTIRYEGVVAREDLERVMESSGLMEVLGKLGQDGAAIAGLENLEPLPIRIWVEQETYYPVKCELDLTGLMQLLMTQGFGEELGDIRITKAVGSTTIGEINQVSGLQPPAEREIVRGKCMDPDCSRDQVSTGESHYCSLHSDTCLNCGKYIDQGELFCGSCTSSVLAQAQEGN